MKDVRAFLKRNGFKRIETNSYVNAMCNVVIETDTEDGSYAVANNDGDTIYSENLSIYWLLGVLLWFGYISNYKK